MLMHLEHLGLGEMHDPYTLSHSYQKEQGWHDLRGDIIAIRRLDTSKDYPSVPLCTNIISLQRYGHLPHTACGHTVHIFQFILPKKELKSQHLTKYFYSDCAQSLTLKQGKREQQ